MNTTGQTDENGSLPLVFRQVAGHTAETSDQLQVRLFATLKKGR
jgi:hypothetical protein